MSRWIFQQKGLSLVELMVAMLITSFLILGVTQVYLDNKRTYLAQHGHADTQDNSRFALYAIEQLLLKTGYKTLPQDSREIAFPYQAAGSGCPAFQAGQTVLPTASGKGVCIRYQHSSNNEKDCLGATIDTSNAIVTRLELDTKTNELQCAAQGATAQTLVSDVVDIRFSFGIDTNDDRLAESYATDPDTNASLVSVRTALLQGSASNSIALAKQVYHFPLSASATTTAPDTRLYRSAQTTVTLRNIAQ
ncbi:MULTISPECIES: PilW family protein [unclassified Pseudomonas]|uniref:PilW family protein n=1 Tax=unclassified Pseudomonas TaxID=196821 RepID=UPI000730AEEC|nr:MULTISPECIES: PilW family protein [unclassified Pseudomonas]KSW26171.1 hypothetical protein AOX63_21255 [Pseudomonas sp. ADP]OBP10935.1 hypothetical protein BAE52_11670 [Pseudomonas sp. EGD-AKN5]QOF82800.1 PilW family protein [Pseudomonas sp. ADPe]